MKRSQWFVFALILFLGGLIMINFSYNPSSMSPDTALIRIGIFTAFGQALVLIGLACGICGWLEPKQK